MVDPTAVDDPVNHPVHYAIHPSGVECIERASAWPSPAGTSSSPPAGT